MGAAARGAWNLGEFDHARSLAARAENRRPPPGAARTGHPADVVAEIALYEGDVDAALRHYTREVTAARQAGDPIRLVWTLYYVAVCHAARRTPRLGVSVNGAGDAIAHSSVSRVSRSAFSCT